MDQECKQINLEKIEQDKAIDQASEGLLSDRPYQPNKGSLQEGMLPEKNLKDLLVSFVAIYSVIFVLISVTLIFSSKRIRSYIDSGTYPHWLWFFLGLLLLLFISLVAYYLCQKKIPKDDVNKKLQGQFKTVAFGFSILLPFVLPVVMYSLWLIVPILL